MTVQEVNFMRRSVHNFDKDKPVNMELVKKVIEEAGYAPSGYNLQPWRVIIIQSDESKEKLYNLAYKQDKIIEAPITLIIIADKEAYLRHNPIWDHISKDIGEDKVQETINRISKSYQDNELKKTRSAHTNTSLYSMNLMTLFKAYGIDTHPIGGFKESEVKEAFNIKNSEDINMLISVGHHDKNKPLITRRRRKTFKEISSIL